jgi:hypothetical protein
MIKTVIEVCLEGLGPPFGDTIPAARGRRDSQPGRRSGGARACHRASALMPRRQPVEPENHGRELVELVHQVVEVGDGLDVRATMAKPDIGGGRPDRLQDHDAMGVDASITSRVSPGCKGAPLDR